MLETALSADTQALLLLCTRLGLATDVRPLSLAEWNRVAPMLAERGRRPGDLLGGSASDLARTTGVDPSVAERMSLLLERGGQLALELERLAGRGIWVCSRVDEAYPRRWKERLKATAPVVVYGAGSLPANGRAMAIVGSRDVDDAALAFTTRVAAICAAAEIAVVSGGARGSDRAAVAACLEAGGRGYVVLADSLEQTLRNREVLARVRSERLTLLTQEHPSRPFSPATAMSRNRLIYTLADSAVVVSSALETGGTWSGAVETLRHRWVPVFVRDGHGVPEGNRHLIRRGANRIHEQDVSTVPQLEALLRQEAMASADRQPMLRESPPDYSSASAQTVPVSTTPEPSTPGAVDAYELVIDRIVPYCAEPRTAEDIGTAFKLQLAQVKVWVSRAVKEKRLRRRVRPVRYEMVGKSGLFE